MAEYINEEPCEFIYNVTAIEKIVDGDTLDAVIDLGFDVRYCGRVVCSESIHPNLEQDIRTKKFMVSYPKPH